MSRHAKRGFPAKFQVAQRHAPDTAGETEIRCVAKLAVGFALKSQQIKILWRRIEALETQAGSEPAGNETCIQQWGEGE